MIPKMAAKQLDPGPAKMGRLLRVLNQNRKFGSALSYYAVQVEDEKGGHERCLLFTQNEIERAVMRANSNREDLTTKGFFQDLTD